MTTNQILINKNKLKIIILEEYDNLIFEENIDKYYKKFNDKLTLIINAYNKKTINEANGQNIDVKSIFELVLDVAGFIPGLGEVADFMNVLFLVYNKNYFGAAMSAISMVPEIGDIIGKSLKYFQKLGKKLDPKVIDFIVKNMPTIISGFKKFAPVLIKKLPTIINKLPKISPQKKQQILNFLNNLANSSIPVIENILTSVQNNPQQFFGNNPDIKNKSKNNAKIAKPTPKSLNKVNMKPTSSIMKFLKTKRRGK